MNTIHLALISILTLAAPPACAQEIWTNVQLDSGEKRRLLTFARDIVSVGVATDFEHGKISSSNLIRLGIYLVALRQQELFQGSEDESEVRLAAVHVNKTVSRYFGKSVRHGSIGGWRYSRGYYHGYSENFEQTEYEEVKRLRVYGAGKNKFNLRIDYVDSMASSDSPSEVIAKAVLSVKKVSWQGKSRFILTGYKSS